MKKFSDIEQLRHIVKYLRNKTIWEAKEKYGDDFDGSKVEYPTMDFVGTVKLHGSNCGIVRNSEGIKFQSRERIITVDDDNYGFARYMDAVGDTALNEIFDYISLNREDEITIFGEWIGKGIQKKVAVSQLERQFVIFQIHVNGEYVPNNITIKSPMHNIHNILACKPYMVTLDLNDLEEAKKKIEEYVSAIDSVCPWGRLFGVDGHGEGIVWCSVDDPENSSLWFKTKGESHKISKQKEVVQVAPEVLESISEFVEYSITDARFTQGLRFVIEDTGVSRDMLDMKQFGNFIKWVGQDIKKEEYDVLESNNLEWKQVAKPIANKTREWFEKIISI